MSAVQTINCRDCGTTWQRPTASGRRPQRCTPCQTEAKRALQRARVKTPATDPTPRLVTNLVNCRLAIEIALPAIKIGRYQDAIDALEAAR